MLHRFKLLSFPAIAEEDEKHVFNTPFGERVHERRAGEALHPERESLEVYEGLKILLGHRHFQSQYNQSPVPVGGNLIHPDWFRKFGPYDLLNVDAIVQSWDTAFKATQLNDYSVCITCALKSERIYVIDVFRERLEYPALKKRVIEHARHFGAKTVLIEDKGSGMPLLQDLQLSGFYDAAAIVPVADKISRFNGVTAMIEQGRVYLPENAPWAEAYLRELCAFPRGKHDDQVDATSQALDWIRSHQMEPHLIAYYRQELEKQKAYSENRTVHMRAPVGVTTVQLLDGHSINLGQDGTLWVTPENAWVLRSAGFVQLN